MKREPVLRMSMVAVPVMIGCGLVVAASSARVDQEPGTAHDDGDTKACTNRTLHGDYGSSVEGLILSAPGVTFPIRGVVMTHYDGNGTFTQVNHIVFNGTAPTIEWTPGTGAYQINAHCTGTAHIATSTGGFVTLVLVVVSQGKQINSVVTAPFDGPDRDVTSVGIKASCDRTKAACSSGRTERGVPQERVRPGGSLP
jgi:hypothetical protein